MGQSSPAKLTLTAESDGNTTYCLRIEYAYDYENETYTGDMISHSIHSSYYDAARCGF